MSIARNAAPRPAPFEGAEVSKILTTQAHSAPSNGAKGLWGSPIYKHATPTG